ncbi:MAG: metal-sulfur cluster assembly factor [Arenicellales bacterium]|jgi:metal-sulfur cluster biosynthetic enzyme|nr:metal-sulfur cluster assembly factor [Arenicellales bacterium]MDP7156345.1 metal-sulfur cluster assembly factor [Arenicellales bacterium]MDP7282879.1 metal-sulfur cluster assembly factor [Arenicellales bacterium]MDP7481502.1 metal-sulfur cluster assembly factor [Arenicellales bacterium]MDP7522468.1 metal-sulfur cluster assembly factor [Arenicellales bacterium]|tara:strand:+ start:229 stop:531 length:303 start_codon:yes stop_codon:yes gene_type:complete
MAVSESQIRSTLQGVLDPEIGINIVDLGLVRQINLGEACVDLVITMTSPACPLSGYISDEITRAVNSVDPELKVNITIESDPLWTHEEMSDAAREELGWH